MLANLTIPLLISEKYRILPSKTDASHHTRAAGRTADFGMRPRLFVLRSWLNKLALFRPCLWSLGDLDAAISGSVFQFFHKFLRDDRLICLLFAARVIKLDRILRCLLQHAVIGAGVAADPAKFALGGRPGQPPDALRLP